MNSNKIDYETDEKWSDVIPILQQEGENSLAQIAYTTEYSQATSYLRAVMASDEKSERAMELTEHIIKMNPAHYTVWLYRADIIKALSLDPVGELNKLEVISMNHPKNFQIWGYRQSIMSMVPTLPSRELLFLARVLAKDAKNYHVWAYRQWLVEHFSLWPTIDNKGSELMFVDSLLVSDVRNNSAWNHRYFVLFGPRTNHTVPPDLFSQEISFVKTKIDLAPQNAAAWNYLKGVLRRQGKGLSEIEEFALEHASLENESEIRSTHALDILADIWTTQAPDKARQALDLLSSKYDPVRANYWQYRKSLIKVAPVS